MGIELNELTQDSYVICILIDLYKYIYMYKSLACVLEFWLESHTGGFKTRKLWLFKINIHVINVSVVIILDINKYVNKIHRDIVNMSIIINVRL